MRNVRILIVDFHPIVRRGLAALLSEEPEFSVCGETDNLQSAIDLVRGLRPQLVLVELSLQNGSGLDLIKELSTIDRGVRICVFSMQDETMFAERALRAGAQGYISKTSSLPEILQALRKILDDRVYLSDAMTHRVLSRSVGKHDRHDGRSPLECLSDRELEVFERLGRGIGTRQIADQLSLSPKTVETYRENIKLKLNLHNAAELTRHAVKWVLETGGAVPSGKI